MKVKHEVNLRAILNRVVLLVATLGSLFPGLAGAQGVFVLLPPDRAPPSDSTYPYRDCKSVKEPIGFVTGRGAVGYWLGRDGRADTSTVRVIEAQGISVAGYRSAVIRFLAGCRVSLPRGFPREGRAVAQQIGLAGSGFQPLPATALDSLPPGIPVMPVLVPTTGLPLVHDDARLEERPTIVFGCMPRHTARPPRGTYSSIQEAQRDFDNWAAANSGNIRISVEIGTDGRAVSNSAKVLESDNPSATSSLLANVMRCRFAPGRIGGRPVPAVAIVSQGQSMVRTESTF